MEKKTILDQIEITRDGTIQVRLAILVLEDGEEISSAWHRMSIPPGTNPAEQIALVNTHLQQMKKEPLQNAVLIEQVAAVVHTPEVKQRYEEKQAKAMEELTASDKARKP